MQKNENKQKMQKKNQFFFQNACHGGHFGQWNGQMLIASYQSKTMIYQSFKKLYIMDSNILDTWLTQIGLSLSSYKGKILKIEQRK